MFSMSFPVGVLVSRFMARMRRLPPLASILFTMLQRSWTLLANLSSLVAHEAIALPHVV